MCCSLERDDFSLERVDFFSVDRVRLFSLSEFDFFSEKVELFHS